MWPIFSLMRLDKPIGIFLLLWPTLWAVWLAGDGLPSFKIVSVFLLGTILVRSAGCVINDIADRQFDRHVARTRERPLVTGAVTLTSALVGFFVLMFCAFLLVLTLNALSIQLACVGFSMAVIYPFLKRYTHLPQVFLGLAFSWGIPMAFAAEQNTIPYAAWLLYGAAVLWPIIYDTLYAMADRNDDVKIGVKSTAILFGKADKIIIAGLQCLFLFLMGMIGLLFSLKSVYFICLLLSACFFVYQHTRIKDREPANCFAAFRNNNWVGFIIFCGIAMGHTI